MKRVTSTMAVVLMVYSTTLSGFPWDKDMVDQITAKPQKSEVPAEPRSIPVVGGEFLPPAATEREQFEGKEAAKNLVNPIPATPESIARGAYLYELTCQVCHGRSGAGDGPVGLKLTEKQPVDLSDVYTQDQTDGELFFTLTRGRVTMPFYRDALSETERWDVVNYIRAEFGER